MGGVLNVLAATGLWVLVTLTGTGIATGTVDTHTFQLGLTTSSGTPSAYAWSTTLGTLSSTTAANPTLTLTVAAGNVGTAAVTCQVTVDGATFTGTGTYKYENLS